MKRSLFLFLILFAFVFFLIRLRAHNPISVEQASGAYVAKANSCSVDKESVAITKEKSPSQDFMIVGCGGFI